MGGTLRLGAISANSSVGVPAVPTLSEPGPLSPLRSTSSSPFRSVRFEPSALQNYLLPRDNTPLTAGFPLRKRRRRGPGSGRTSSTRSFSTIPSRTRSLRQAAPTRRTEGLEVLDGAARGTCRFTEIATPDDTRLNLLIPLSPDCSTVRQRPRIVPALCTIVS